MRKWTNDDWMMIACCNDGTRPVIFKIERIDIPETPEEEEWLSKQDFHNGADQAYSQYNEFVCEGSRKSANDCQKLDDRLLYR